MTTYTVEMRRTAGLSEAERRRRLAQCYKFILSLTTRSSDAPASETGEPGAGASGGQHGAGHQAQYTSVPAVVQVRGGAGFRNKSTYVKLF